MQSLRKSSKRESSAPGVTHNEKQVHLGRFGGDPTTGCRPAPQPPSAASSLRVFWPFPRTGGSPTCLGGSNYCSFPFPTLLQVCPVCPFSGRPPTSVCKASLLCPVLPSAHHSSFNKPSPACLWSHPSPHQTLRSVRTELGVSWSTVQSTCHGAADVLKMFYKMAQPVIRNYKEQMKFSSLQY